MFVNDFQKQILSVLVIYIRFQVDSMVSQSTPNKFRRTSTIFIVSVYITATFVIFLDVIMYYKTAAKFGSRYFFEYFGFYCLYYILITHEVFFWHTIYVINIKITKVNELLQIEEFHMQSPNLKNINALLDTLKVKPYAKIVVGNFEVPFRMSFSAEIFPNDGK